MLGKTTTNWTFSHWNSTSKQLKIQLITQYFYVAQYFWFIDLLTIILSYRWEKNISALGQEDYNYAKKKKSEWENVRENATLCSKNLLVFPCFGDMCYEKKFHDIPLIGEIAERIYLLPT